MIHRALLPLVMVLASCMPITRPEPPSRAIVTDAAPLPPMKLFAVPRPTTLAHANADLARDFIELSFSLESGRTLPVFTRFEGPISVTLTGSAPGSLSRDLDRLIHRLQTEAGIPISRTNSSANITIEAVTRQEIRRFLPNAACFVVPNVSSLREYGRARRAPRVNWAKLEVRDRLAIFVPNDVSPQEMRDCLHEELAQAIGPLNDLYRLPDSVFNDDNVHTVLTGYDMMVLRAYYHPSLRSGMTPKQVAARLPSILAQVNPGGEGLQPRLLSRTPRTWINAIQTALGPGANPSQRTRAAKEALQIATAMGWTDHRRAFSHFAMGRMIQSSNPEAAQDQFALADRYYSTRGQTALHRAYVASQLAAYSITRNQPREALRVLAPHIDTAQRHENAALLATLLMLRAEALALDGQTTESRNVQLDSLGWARYGFGSDWEVRARQREISSLNPLRRRTSGI